MRFVIILLLILMGCVTINENLPEKCSNNLLECGRRCSVFEEGTYDFEECISICNDQFEICIDKIEGR